MSKTDTLRIPSPTETITSTVWMRSLLYPYENTLVRISSRASLRRGESSDARFWSEASSHTKSSMSGMSAVSAWILRSATSTRSSSQEGESSSPSSPSPASSNPVDTRTSLTKPWTPTGTSVPGLRILMRRITALMPALDMYSSRSRSRTTLSPFHAWHSPETRS